MSVRFQVIPDNADSFKEWADRVCVDWPAQLQGQSWKAWHYLVVTSADDFSKFKEQYENWVIESTKRKGNGVD